MPLVLVSEGSSPTTLAWLKTQVDVIEADNGDALFERYLPEVEGLLVRTYTRVDDELLGRAPKLRVVGRGGVGLENIDVAACRKRGVQVVYTPEANTDAVSEFVFGQILQLVRPWFPFRDHAYSGAEFKRIRETYRGRQLNELTLGILGMGRIGRRVGHIAALGFDMRVVYHDVVDVSALVPYPAVAVDEATLYREADVLTIHIDTRPSNRRFVGPTRLAQLKPTTLVINTSRGEVLDTDALADALRNGRLAGAAIDVFDPEPPGEGLALLGLENVLLTPHLAARTTTAIENMSWVVRDVVEVLYNRKPRFAAP